MQTYPKFVGVIALCAVVVLALASGASSNSARTTGATQAARHQADPINIAYLTKQLASVSFFTAQSKILTELASQYGAVVKTQDLGDQSNGDQAITILDTAIAGGAKAIVITVPTTAIGPTVISKAQAAKIPMVALFDQIKSASGEPLPFIGLSDKQFGNDGRTGGGQAVPEDEMAQVDARDDEDRRDRGQHRARMRRPAKVRRERIPRGGQGLPTQERDPRDLQQQPAGRNHIDDDR